MGTLFKQPVSVSRPEINKIEYEEIQEGCWAYLSECPTTRAFGETKQSAFRNLIVLLHRCE